MKIRPIFIEVYLCQSEAPPTSLWLSARGFSSSDYDDAAQTLYELLTALNLNPKSEIDHSEDPDAEPK